MIIVHIFDDVELIYSRGKWVSSNPRWANAFNIRTTMILEEMESYHPSPDDYLIDKLLEEFPYARVVYREESKHSYDPDVVY